MTRRGAVLRRVVANSRLRRIELAFVGFACGEHGAWVAMIVFAFQQGGTGEAAVIAVAQLLPAAAVAPWASRLADRRGGAVGLWAGYLAQALGMGATAVLLALDAPAVAAYGGAVVAASAVTLTRPAQGALLPALVDDPAELTAANAITGWLESVSVFVGPALTGALIAISGPGAAFALFAVAVAGSCALVTPIARESWRATGGAVADAGATEPGALAALRSEPAALALLGVFAMQFVAYGAFDVLVVVLAIDVLGLGPSGGGFLNAAFGAGGVAGGAAAVMLVGRARLVPPLLGAAGVWGLAFMLIGAVPAAGAAFGLMVVAGSGWTVLDVAGRTLLQRAVPAAVRGRVFGVLEGLSMVSLAVGSLLVPLFVELGGARLAVAAIGALLAAMATAQSRWLSRLDHAPAPATARLALLRSSPLFSSLAPPALEGLALALVEQHADSDEVVIRQGERGDRFYLVASGTVAVSRDGRDVRMLGRGDGFGEIALLRDGVRTSTVTAREPVVLFALERDAFLASVAGHSQARGAAERLVAERLAADALR